MSKSHLTCVAALAAVVGILTPASSYAADDPQAPRPWLAQQPAPGASASAPGGGFGWRAWLLLGVAAGGAALAIHLKRKRVLRLRSVMDGADARLRVVDTTRVGPKAQLVVAQVGERLLLLGVTERSVRRIAWLGRNALGAERADAPRAATPARRFAESFREALGQDDYEDDSYYERRASRALRDTARSTPLAIAAETRDVVEVSAAARRPAKVPSVFAGLEGQVASIAARARGPR